MIMSEICILSQTEIMEELNFSWKNFQSHMTAIAKLAKRVDCSKKLNMLAIKPKITLLSKPETYFKVAYPSPCTNCCDGHLSPATD